MLALVRNDAVINTSGTRAAINKVTVVDAAVAQIEAIRSKDKASPK